LILADYNFVGSRSVPYSAVIEFPQRHSLSDLCKYLVFSYLREIELLALKLLLCLRRSEATWEIAAMYERETTERASEPAATSERLHQYTYRPDEVLRQHAGLPLCRLPLATGPALAARQGEIDIATLLLVSTSARGAA